MGSETGPVRWMRDPHYLRGWFAAEGLSTKSVALEPVRAERSTPNLDRGFSKSP